MSRIEGDRYGARRRLVLQPGEWFVGGADWRIATLLGSCISVTIWHPVRRVGAMLHFLLPTRVSARGQAQRSGRFGDEAIGLMMERLVDMGVQVSECEGKIFGGGNMFPGQFRDDSQTVGRQNGEAARKLLLAHGIALAAEHLYGVGHRRIEFDIASGDVWMHHVSARRTEREMSA